MTKQPQRQHLDDPIEILLVDDNSDDIQLIKEGFTKTDTKTTIHTASDGYEAIAFLKKRGASESPSLPDLALVDLDIPGKDGCEVLNAIRADPQLECLPVLMLTSSDASDDVIRCYNARANAYITKPTDIDEYISLAKAIEQFWFAHVQLPPEPH